MTENRWWDYRC